MQAVRAVMSSRQYDKAIVESDILLGAGRLLLDGDTPVAYASLIVSDPGYEALGDIWRYSGPYGVIHRMAVSDAYRGESGCQSMANEPLSTSNTTPDLSK